MPLLGPLAEQHHLFSSSFLLLVVSINDDGKRNTGMQNDKLLSGSSRQAQSLDQGGNSGNNAGGGAEVYRQDGADGSLQSA